MAVLENRSGGRQKGMVMRSDIRIPQKIKEKRYLGQDGESRNGE